MALVLALVAGCSGAIEDTTYEVSHTAQREPPLPFTASAAYCAPGDAVVRGHCVYDGTPKYTSERIQRTEHGEAWTCVGDVERVTAVARCEARQAMYTRTERADGAGGGARRCSLRGRDEVLSGRVRARPRAPFRAPTGRRRFRRWLVVRRLPARDGHGDVRAAASRLAMSVKRALRSPRRPQVGLAPDEY